MELIAFVVYPMEANKLIFLKICRWLVDKDRQMASGVGSLQDEKRYIQEVCVGGVGRPSMTVHFIISSVALHRARDEDNW